MSAWFERFDAQIAELMPDVPVLKDEPMSRHTTFRIGGNARRAVHVRFHNELTTLLSLAEKEKYPYLVVGNGSNLLVSDAGVDALVLFVGDLRMISLLTEDILYVDCGVKLAQLAICAMMYSLTGFEFAHGIPGTIGGAICMNAGAYGGEMSQVLMSVDAWLPGKGECKMSLDELDLGYRRSYFSDHDGVVLGAIIKLRKGDKNEIDAQMEDLIRRRKEKQPLNYPSAGSTFKRPDGHFAGALIEQCGLKGVSIGGAQVSEKHAGFIINTGNATCADVLGLIEKVRETVLTQTGVLLEPEVKIIG